MSDEELHAPGLIRRRRANGEARYWMPHKNDVKRGYPLKSLSIPAHCNEKEAAALCRKYQAELEAWRNGAETGPVKYSFAWLIKHYLEDKSSGFQKLRHNTQKNYAQDCAIIEKTIGKVRFDHDGHDAIIGENFFDWHEKWGQPGPDGEPTTPSRARHLITMLRILVKHAVTKGAPRARDLTEILSTMHFPTTAVRDVAPDLSQVMAVVNTALAQGLRSVAIATLAQYELTERRISIIGSWDKNKQWRPGWVWTGVNKDWVINYIQHKRKVVKRVYDLKTTPVLLELLQRTPPEKRIGPIIICESTGLPWKEKHYTDTWREVARAAGVPDEIQSMDMRAGGATEADGLGVSDRELQDALGHSDPKMKDRYRRNKQKNAQNVVNLRQASRKT